MSYWHINRHIISYHIDISTDLLAKQRQSVGRCIDWLSADTVGRYVWQAIVHWYAPDGWLQCNDWCNVMIDVLAGHRPRYQLSGDRCGYPRSKGVNQHVNGVLTNSWPTVDQNVDGVTVDSFTKRYLKYAWWSCNIIVYCNWRCRSSWSLETAWTMDWTLGSVVRLNQSGRKS